MLLVGVGAALFLAAFAVTIFLYRSSRPNLALQASIDFQPYISAYTSGIIPRQSTIRVVFAKDVASPDQLGQPAKSGLVKFSPRIKGQMVWANTRTLEFTPAQPLESGKSYTGEVAIDELFTDVPSKAQTFYFTFQTISQQAEFTHVYYYAVQEGGKVVGCMRGVITTADDADLEKVQEGVSLRQGSKKLDVTLTNGDSERSFYFTSSPVTLEGGDVDYSFKGKPIDAPDLEPERYDMPDADRFYPYDNQVNDYGEQNIRIFFSRPLDARQNLDGLVYADDSSVSFRCKTDGNILTVYPMQKVDGEFSLTIDRALRDASGHQLGESYEMSQRMDGGKPDVQFLQEGSILPATGNVYVPFQAKGLKAVDVTVFRIYESNVAQYFQVNSYDYGGDQLRRVGTVLLRKTVMLDAIKASSGIPGVYALDLSKLIQLEPGAIYRIGLSMRRELSAYSCPDAQEREIVDIAELRGESGDDYDDYEYYDYDWGYRNDPCNDAYYMNRGTRWQTLLVSNIGLIAKKSEGGSMRVYSTSITESKPISGVTVKLLDYQLQQLAEGSTGSDGSYTFNYSPEAQPFLIIAEQGTQRSYLPVRYGGLSFSTFDVSGTSLQKGVQGFLYGERSVWRPGDTIYMSLVLEDRMASLPDNHPVVFTFYNPNGQLVERKVLPGNPFKMYTFITSTDAEAMTGVYRIEARVGSVKFHKSVRIETIKPNRIKMELTFDNEYLMAERENPMRLSARWLHGAPARHLNADVTVRVVQGRTTFDGYDNYSFADEISYFSPMERTLFDGQLDEDGEAVESPMMPAMENAPGMLRASINVRVFEEGGGYSFTSFTKPVSPYKSYVGIRQPDADRYYLETDRKQTFGLAVLSPEGHPQANVPLTVQLYKLDWGWWWEHDNSSIASYIESHSSALVEAYDDIRTNSQGKAEVVLRVNYPAWGRYLVRVVNEESGHVATRLVFWDWPDSQERGAERAMQGSTVLGLLADKGKYDIGQEAKVYVPTPLGGTLLVSIENGSTVLKSYWMEAESGKTTVKVPITEGMAPNVYVNVMLLQPYGQTANDLPLRMYGVIPLMVEDPKTHLTPVIEAPAQVRPESPVEIVVKEKDGRPMSFTLAVVDEGLLDITSFKTPDPWKTFYERQALGVSTYDLFDAVIGAYGGRISSVLSVGGADALMEFDDAEDSKANRFTPVVRFFGPFHLEGKKRQRISFQMPNYIGSVRVMAIASGTGAYGASESTMKVSNPLMVQATLPRVLGVNERFELPITVFTTTDNIKDVAISVETSDKISVAGSATSSVQFSKAGEKTISIPLSTSARTGRAKVKVTAKSKGESASSEIEIMVRNPNPRISGVVAGTIAPGKTFTLTPKELGMLAEATGSVEVSDLPSLNLPELLDYMQSYPHACLEQQSSRAFVQMLYGRVTKISKGKQDSLAAEVRAFIGRIPQFQLSNGGFSLWPNMSYPHQWATSYVGHFMCAARELGYSVPSSIISQWVQFQQREARSWSASRDADNPAILQAYRLYTLALAGQPDMGAMNRLREVDDLDAMSRWRLAAAYAMAGNRKAADQLISGAVKAVAESERDYYSFGSLIRNQAMLLESLTLLKDFAGARTSLQAMANAMRGQQWYSTQEIGYAMLSYAKFVQATNAGRSGVQGVLTVNGTSHNVDVKGEAYTMKYTPLSGKATTVSFTNKGKEMLYIVLTQSGIPTEVVQRATANNLKCNVTYSDMRGNPISVANLRQGTDFIAAVTVSNPGQKGDMEQLSLNFALPAGWEVRNERIEGSSGLESSSYEYQDYRDDRVYTYFNLRMGASKTFYFVINASYLGTFVRPPVSCTALYDGEINASTEGGMVTVSR